MWKRRRVRQRIEDDVGRGEARQRSEVEHVRNPIATVESAKSKEFRFRLRYGYSPPEHTLLIVLRISYSRMPVRELEMKDWDSYAPSYSGRGPG